MSSIGPPTGMRDWLPQDALLRQRLIETISSVYRLYGYLPIDTPAMEDLAVLKQYNLNTNFVFEDKDLAYLFGFASFAR